MYFYLRLLLFFLLYILQFLVTDMVEREEIQDEKMGWHAASVCVWNQLKEDVILWFTRLNHKPQNAADHLSIKMHAHDDIGDILFSDAIKHFKQLFFVSFAVMASTANANYTHLWLRL